MDYRNAFSQRPRMGDTGNGLLPNQPTDLIPANSMMVVEDEPRGASQLIEIPVPVAGTTKIVFPVIQNLQNQVGINVVIKALRLITDTVLTFGPTIGGITAPLAELQKMSLVLYSQEWEKGQLIPVLELNDIFTEASGIPWRSRTTRLDSWRNVNWGKSYVIYSNGSGGAAGVPYTLIFEAEYVKFNQQGLEIEGAA